MDFIRWIAWYGEKIHTGAMSLAYFFSDSNEQIQPLMVWIDFLVLEANAYDTWMLVLSGAILRVICYAGLAIYILSERNKAHKAITPFVICCSFLILATGLNLNQWEMTNEPFGLTNTLRIVCYLASFIWVEKLFAHFYEDSFRCQLIKVLLLSLVAAFIALFLSGAYLVGFLGAVSATILISLMIHRKELRVSLIIPALIWAATVIGSIVYYIQLIGSENKIIHAGSSFLDYLRGFLCYLGVSIVPQHIVEETSIQPAVIAGSLLLGVAVLLLFFFFRRKRTERSLLPLTLGMYALIIGATITLGRVQYYGAGTMASSRYSTESVLFPVSLLMMSAELYDEMKPLLRRSLIVLLICVAGSLGFCYQEELRMAPYRAAYQKQMREMMLNSDEYIDDDLYVFQESPEYVRESIAFLKKYNLSVFHDKHPEKKTR